MTSSKRMDDIMDTLYDIYSQYPFVTVKNSQTESLWKEWERLVAQNV